MNRRVPKTKEERLASYRPVSTPKLGRIGTIRKLESGFWEYVRTNGSRGIAPTSEAAVAKLELIAYRENQ